MLRDDGRVHPAELNRPALRNVDRRYYDVFRSLSASRTWSQVGPNPIQISEIAAYIAMTGIDDPGTKLKYLRLVQGMDAVEMKNIRENMKRNTK